MPFNKENGTTFTSYTPTGPYNHTIHTPLLLLSFSMLQFLRKQKRKEKKKKRFLRTFRFCESWFELFFFFVFEKKVGFNFEAEAREE